jgi:hypothetical protein
MEMMEDDTAESGVSLIFTLTNSTANRPAEDFLDLLPIENLKTKG